jgi:hypothetical protein
VGPSTDVQSAANYMFQISNPGHEELRAAESPTLEVEIPYWMVIRSKQWLLVCVCEGGVPYPMRKHSRLC